MSRYIDKQDDVATSKAALTSERVSTAPGHRICVIGAGPCGLTTIKNLLAAGLTDIVCYDEAAVIGGNWAYDESPSRTTVYDATHLISSKRLSEFEDFPMPADYPDFPSHRLMLQYFQSYAAHFRLLPLIEFNTRVERAALNPDGRWTVSVIGDKGRLESQFDYVIVCAGHHRTPLVPDVAGSFSGAVTHASAFKRPDPFHNLRVLVVGGGNSACDISVDVARLAAKTCISMRRGYHIIPKVLYGRPVDLLYARLRRKKWIPQSLLRRIVPALVRLNVGPLEKYGLQRPARGLTEMHPTLNSNILNALRDGSVLAREGIERLEGRTVVFRNGTSEDFDAIIWATGYRTTFPFFDSSVIFWDTNHPPPLFLRMIHPRIRSLFLIGLFQPIGCIWRLADHQARIAALQISGALRRSPNIDRLVENEVSSTQRHFDASPRHAIEVDYHDFRSSLLAELARADMRPLQTAGDDLAGRGQL